MRNTQVRDTRRRAASTRDRAWLHSMTLDTKDSLGGSRRAGTSEVRCAYGRTDPDVHAGRRLGASDAFSALWGECTDGYACSGCCQHAAQCARHTDGRSPSLTRCPWLQKTVGRSHGEFITRGTCYKTCKVLCFDCPVKHSRLRVLSRIARTTTHTRTHCLGHGVPSRRHAVLRKQRCCAPVSVCVVAEAVVLACSCVSVMQP